MHCFITCPKDHIGRLIALVCIVFIWAHSQLFAASMSHELWPPTRGYLQRAYAPNIDFYRSEADISMPGPVPLYRDFMRHYEESLLAADVPKQLDAPEAVELELPDTAPEPPVVSPIPVKKVRVFHAGGATLRGPYSFPRPQHTSRLFDEIYLHFPVAADQQQGINLEGELNQSAVFEPPTAVTPSSSSTYLQVP